MNILILNWRDTTNPNSGGAEYVTRMHAEAWVRRGHRVTWFSSAFEGSKETDVKNGVKFYRRGSSITVFFYAFFYYLTHKKGFDLIVDEVHGIPFFAKFYARIPVVLFIHEVAGVIWDVMYPFPISWVGKMLERLYIRVYRKNYFWTDAESTRRELISMGISSGRCIAIPCPIANLSIKTLPEKNKQPTFLFVGRIVRMKGIEDIFNAFKILLLVLPKAKLWIVGDGDVRYLNSLHSKVKLYGLERNILWWGNVSEAKKLELMAKAHVLLHASVKEGWGLVVLEAASQGTPTVAYPSGGLQDTIINGQTGILTIQKTSASLARAATALYKDNTVYEYMQKKGITWSSHFTWGEATKQSMEFLKRVYKSS